MSVRNQSTGPATVLPIVGISPGNSYFTQEVIGSTLTSVLGDYSRLVIMIPDLPNTHTYQALGGYSPEQARGKALREGGSLRNKVRRAISVLSLDEATIHLLEWAREVEKNAVYQTRLRALQRLYEMHVGFQKAVEASTCSALENKARALHRGHEWIATQIREGVQYLLEELAYLDAAASLHGVEKSVFIYHRPWPILKNYIDGAYDASPKPHMGLKIVHT